MNKLLLLLFTTGFLFIINKTLAQDTLRNEFLIEVDPIPFILGGAGGHFSWSPRSAEHFIFGVSFLAQADLPNAFVNLNDINKNKGWQVKINQGLGFYSQYYFDKNGNSWFAGMQLFTQEMELKNDQFPGESDRTNLILLAFQAGYHWYPFKKTNIFIKPWVGIGYQNVISGTFDTDNVDPDLDVGTLEYELPPIMPFATVHFGYRF